MAATEQIDLKVELTSKIDDIVKAASAAPLTEKQQGKVQAGAEGAKRSVEANDLKTARKQMNSVISIISSAIAQSGKLDGQLEKLVNQRSELNKKLGELEKQKTKLTTETLTKDGSRLRSSAQKEFIKSNKTAEGIVDTKGQRITDTKVLSSILEEIRKVTNGKLSTLTNKQAADAGLKDRGAAFALNKYAQEEATFTGNKQKELANVNSEIASNQSQQDALTTKIDAMAPAAEKAAASLDALYKKIVQLGDSFNIGVTKAQNEQKEKTAGSGSAGSDMKPIGEKQASGLMKAAKAWTIYNVAMRGARRALREAVKTVKELDKSLTEQAMVTGKTREETYKLLGGYQKMAKQLGATTKEVAQVATEYMKQGKSVEDSMVLTQAAISAAKVARVSVGDSVNYLTTALNGFQLAAEDAMAVSDKFAAVAAASATDYDELAIALSKVASQANLAGMSIDYTTALLTKGLETTREAPETMGTALKTIIARMREMKDYGETLEGDTDVNNVESQLAYVGIALKNEQGELRSTQEVLDELGRKWDELNANQQAAIAKALAGTRQQSRLIAMMTDYERVIELQEIAERSEGATVAQMGTYLEGMEAALNKVSVAWESIVSTVTDSEVIIGIVTAFSGILDVINAILGSTPILIGFLTTIAVMGLANLGHKIAENQINQQNLEIARAEAAEDELDQKRKDVASAQEAVADAKRITQRAKEVLQNKEINLQKTLQLKKTLLQKKAEGSLTKEEKLQLSTIDKEIDKQKEEVKLAAKEYNDAKAQQDLAEKKLNVQKNALDTATATNGHVAWLGNALSGLLSVLMIFKPVMLGIVAMQKLLNKTKEKEGRLTVKNTLLTLKAAAAEKIKAAFGMASSASAIPYVGWIIGGAILAAIIGTAIAVGVKSYKENRTSEGTANKVNELSKEVFQLEKQAQALDTVVNKFDAIDNKVLKTNADIKAMNELLEGAGDNLNDEEVDDKDDEGYGKGTSQKEYYESLSTDREKRDFLEKEAEKDREKARGKRQEQLDRIVHLRQTNSKEFDKFMTSDDADMRSARDAIYAMNKANTYDYIDSLKEMKGADQEALAATKNLTNALLDQMDAEDNLDFAEHKEELEDLIDTISKTETAVGDMNDHVTIAEVMTSDDYSIKDKTEAYQEMMNTLTGTAKDAFGELYNEYARFAEMGEESLEFIDKMGINVNKLNDFYASWSKLRKTGLNDVMTEEEFQGTFDQAIKTLADTGGNMEQTMDIVYGSYLDQLGRGSEEYIKAYNMLLGAMDQMLNKSLLDIGQDTDKINNSISSIYEKAKQWNEMSESDRTKFLTDHGELFSGEDGEKLLKAFESGNYDEIQRALENNATLQKQLDEQIKDVHSKLEYERALEGDAYNAATVKYLEDLEKHLKSGSELFQASLQDRLDQEKAQLDIYKEYLEKQQEALTESLDKKKEAYQKYYDSIEESEDDQSYEEEVDQIQSNISKLAGSTDATSMKRQQDLENKLADLEEERLQTLRERAREAVMESIDNEIDRISQQFDELLETDANILKALQKDMETNPDFLSNVLSSNIQGMTELQATDYFRNTFSSAFAGQKEDWSDMQVTKDAKGDLILNVAGQTINLSQDDSDSLGESIYAALRRIGINV